MQVRFSIIQRLNFSGIIGCEGLKKLNMRINSKGGSVSLHSHWFEFIGETVDLNEVNFYCLNFSDDLKYDFLQISSLLG